MQPRRPSAPGQPIQHHRTRGNSAPELAAPETRRSAKIWWFVSVVLTHRPSTNRSLSFAAQNAPPERPVSLAENCAWKGGIWSRDGMPMGKAGYQIPGHRCPEIGQVMFHMKHNLERRDQRRDGDPEGGPRHGERR